MSLAEIVDLLACPHCARPMALQQRILRCSAGHSFDVAKQGYVNLLGPNALQANADTSEMVAARIRFLNRGHYAPFADRIAELAASHGPAAAGRPGVLEAGAGTGHYLGRVLDRLSSARGIASDLSVAAARHSARGHDRIGAVVADTWAGLPVAESSLDLIMVVFAPRNPAEFARVLRPDGRLLVVTAAPDHLAEIREPLGLLDIQPGKRERLQESFGATFEPVHSEQLTIPMRLAADDLADLVSMGPNAHHRTDALAGRIAELAPPVPVSAAVELSVFRARSDPGDDGRS